MLQLLQDPLSRQPTLYPQVYQCGEFRFFSLSTQRGERAGVRGVAVNAPIFNKISSTQVIVFSSTGLSR